MRYERGILKNTINFIDFNQTDLENMTCVDIIKDLTRICKYDDKIHSSKDNILCTILKKLTSEDIYNFGMMAHASPTTSTFDVGKYFV